MKLPSKMLYSISLMLLSFAAYGARETTQNKFQRAALSGDLMTLKRIKATDPKNCSPNYPTDGFVLEQTLSVFNTNLNSYRIYVQKIALKDFNRIVAYCEIVKELERMGAKKTSTTTSHKELLQKNLDTIAIFDDSIKALCALYRNDLGLTEDPLSSALYAERPTFQEAALMGNISTLEARYAQHKEQCNPNMKIGMVSLLDAVYCKINSLVDYLPHTKINARITRKIDNLIQVSEALKNKGAEQREQRTVQVQSTLLSNLAKLMDHNPNLKKLYDDLSKIVPATTRYQEEHKEKVLSTIKH